MNERIKKIRKDKGMTQAAFGDLIKVKANTITNYETGLRTPSDAVINSICREFHVSEQWLRTGEGSMYVVRTRDDEIAEYLTRVAFGGETTAFQRSLIAVMARMSVEEWEMLEAKARELLAECEKETADPKADCDE